MKILFEEDSTNGYSIYFALSKMEVWCRKVHEELMWAEITPSIGNQNQTTTFKVVWEDDFYNPLYFKTLTEAKDYITKNYSTHKPHINGVSWKAE